MTPHAPQNNGWMDPDPKGMWFHADEVAALEAENAELRREIVYWKKGCIGHATDLASANATLDKLSEVFGTDKPLPFCNNCDSYQAEWQDDECISCGGNLDTSSLMLCDIYAILYPTPENENEQ